ncbi:MAG: DUF4159 domain-containing protein [Gemmatimonadaceae bacterium]|nr:DUF4159 domain-containing protein [Gemmatimonadaceae bacterium]
MIAEARSLQASTRARRAHIRLAGLAAAALAAALAAPCVAQAQRGGRFPGGAMRSLGDPNSFYTPPDFHGNPPYDGRFTFARIKYRGFGRWSGREGPGWAHDYPDADVHFMKIVREVTAMRPFVAAGPIVGGAIVALDDPELFKYPVAYLSEPGGWFPNATEASALARYLRKGGFLIIDDFPAFDWNTMEAAMTRVLPDLRPVRMTGKEPIFDSFYKADINRVSSEYGMNQGFYAWYENNDPTKRLYAVACYNNDIGEAWQWSGRGFVSVDVSNEAFKLGINFLVYALTH